MTIRIGIIGYGGMGRYHAFEFRKIGAEIVGAVANTEQTINKIQNELNIPAYRSLDKLFKNNKLDAVVVSSPNALHAEHVMHALNSNCHVLCEKPLATTPKDAIEMVKCSKAKKRILMLAHNLRFLPNALLATKLLKKKCLGEIYHARCSWIRNRGIPSLGNWFTNRKLSGGGALIDIGVHVLDLAWYFMGKPLPHSTSGQAYALFEKRIHEYTFQKMWGTKVNNLGIMNVEDFCSAFVRFNNTSTLQLEVAWAVNQRDSDCRIELYGDNGGLIWRRNQQLVLFDSKGKRVHIPGTIPEDICGRLLTPFRHLNKFLYKVNNRLNCQNDNMHTHFLNVINDKEDCLVPASDGVVTQEIIDGIYRSSSAGHEITFN